MIGLVKLIVINGGLQPGDSYSMFSAPTDGYVPSFSLQRKIRGGGRGSIGDKKFYVMLKNGKVFGRIQIDLVAPFNVGIPGLIRLSYVIISIRLTHFNDKTGLTMFTRVGIVSSVLISPSHLLAVLTRVLSFGGGC